MLAAVVIGGLLISRAFPSFAPRSIVAGGPAAISIDAATGLPAVQVTVNGHGPYLFLADTGAAATVVTADLARELGLGQGIGISVGRPGGLGTSSGRVAHVDHMTVGTTLLNDLDVVVLDLSAVWTGDAGPRGVLSLVTLRDVLVTIDLAARTLAVTSGALSVPDGIATFGWADGSPIPTMTIEIGGMPTVAAVDTGSTFAFTLPDRYAATLALLRPPVAGPGDRGVDGTLATRTATLADPVRVAGRAVDAPKVSFADVPRAKVGFAALGGRRLVIDAAQRRLRVD